MDLQEYLEIITKRKWIILILLIVIPLTTWIKLSLTPSIYEAETKIIIGTSDDQMSVSSIIGGRSGGFNFNRRPNLENEILFIKSKPIIKQVIEKLHLENDKGLPIHPCQIIGNLTLKIIPETSVLSIKFCNRDKTLASAILQTLTDVMIENNLKFQQTKLHSAKNFLISQLDIRKQSLRQAESRLQKYNENNSSFSIPHEMNNCLNQLTALTTEKIKLESEQRSLAEKEGLLNEKIAENANAPFSIIQPWKAELQPISIEKFSMDVQLKGVDSEINSLTQKLKKLAPKEFEFNRLKQELEIENEMYTEFIRSLEQIKLEEASQIPTIRIIEPAETKNRPVYPVPEKTVPIAATIGLILGLLIALVLEYFDNKLRTPKEIEKITGWPRLGVIPIIQEIDGQSGRTESLITLSPKSHVTESFQILRTNIHYSSFDKAIQTMLISSCIMGEGKTTVISNLAIAYARLGKKVVLIDSDMRKPKIHKTFKFENRIGLTNILVDKMPYQNVVHPVTELPNLSIITSGPIPPNPVELLESHSFKELVDTLKQNFDLILFDAPPLTAVTDAAILAHKLDGFMFDIDINVCPRLALKQIYELTKNLKIKVLGYVLNRFDFETRYGYYKSYKYYSYTYEKDDKTAIKTKRKKILDQKNVNDNNEKN